jgi:hypothetical protein
VLAASKKLSTLDKINDAADSAGDAAKAAKAAKHPAPKIVDTPNPPSGGALVPKGTTPLGKWGEARLAHDLGNQGFKPRSPFNTSLGNRYLDRLLNGVAHEAKAGVNVGLTANIRKQVLKDVELIGRGRINGAHWHFYQGAQQDLLDFLTQNGIQYTVH